MKSTDQPTRDEVAEAVARAGAVRRVYADDWLSLYRFRPRAEPTLCVGPLVRPLLGGGGAGGASAPVVESIRESTPTGGASPTLGVDETWTVPPGHDCIYVWVGEFATNDVAYVLLHVNISGQTRTHALMRHGFACIPAASGKRWCWQAQRRTGSTATPSGTGTMPTLRFATGRAPEDFAAVATSPQTCPVDVSAIPLWEPIEPHIVLATEHSKFTIAAETYPRVVYVAEQDQGGAWTHPRALVIEANRAVTVQCRYQRIALACVEAVFGGGRPDSLDLRLPSGAVVTSAQHVFSVPFTVVRTVACSNATEFKAALAGAEDGDDIVLADGSYDMSASGDRIISTNYALAATRTIRIRSQSADRAACTVRCAWDINLFGQTTKWVVESLTLDIDGLSPVGNGMIQTRGGEVWIVDCLISGEGSGANDKSISHYHTTYQTRHYLVGSEVRGAKDDAVDASNSGNATLTVVGCLVSGNGADVNDQLATCHGGATVELWNCRFTDAAKPANAPKIVPDSVSSMVMRYCVQPTGLIAHASGLTIQTIRAIEGCVLPQCAANVSLKNGYAIRSVLTMSASSGNLLQPNAGTTDDRWTGANLLIGSRFTAANSSGANCLQIQSTAGTPHELEFHGCEFRAQHSSNGSCCRFTDASNPPTGSVLFANCRFIAAGTSNLFRLDNVSAVATLRNCIFGGSTSYTINANGSNTNICTGSIHQGAKPSNWDARFAGAQDGTVFSTTPQLESDGEPTASGNCDGTGLDLGLYGLVDVLGRPLLWGDPPQRGAVSRAAAPTTARQLATTW